MRNLSGLEDWYFIFFVVCIILGFCGAHAPDDQLIRGVAGMQIGDANINSFVWLSRFATLYYFAYFLVITPLIGLTETPLPVPESISEPILSHPAAMPAGAAASPEKRG